MKTIALTKGQFATFDDEDIDLILSHHWRAHRAGRRGYYASAENASGEIIWMHRLVMDAPENMEIDHINHDTLDNRKENLRLATKNENQWNNKRIVTTFGYKGITYDKKKKTYRARIRKNGVRHNLGSYSTARDAAYAYNKASKELHGVFSFPNTI